MLGIPNIHRLQLHRNARGLLGSFAMTIFLSCLVSVAFYAIFSADMRFANESTPVTTDNARHLTAQGTASGTISFNKHSGSRINATLDFRSSTITIPDIKGYSNFIGIAQADTALHKSVRFETANSSTDLSGVFTFTETEGFKNYLQSRRTHGAMDKGLETHWNGFINGTQSGFIHGTYEGPIAEGGKPKVFTAALRFYKGGVTLIYNKDQTSPLSPISQDHLKEGSFEYLMFRYYPKLESQAPPRAQPVYLKNGMIWMTVHGAGLGVFYPARN